MVSLKYGKRIGKNVTEKLSGKCSRKLHYHTKQSATETLKTSSEKVIKKQ